MNTTALPARPHLDSKPGKATVLLFVALLVGGAIYTATSLSHDVQASGSQATTYLPFLLLGLGTMVGWKRIVRTVGEKIGKTHLTYAQGASAELVAMTTIGAADMFGLPVSTTQVLSSGVAGTMAANRSGLQWGTVRNLALAWILTLPMAMLLSGSLYWLLNKLFQ
jgi:phosphate/sulfate permease